MRLKQTMWKVVYKLTAFDNKNNTHFVLEFISSDRKLVFVKREKRPESEHVSDDQEETSVYKKKKVRRNFSVEGEFFFQP